MKVEFLSMVARKHGVLVRNRCEQLALMKEYSNASDVYILDRALFEEHRVEIEAADAEASVPFTSE